MQTNIDKKYLTLAWLMCGLGAIFYSYEYLLRIVPSVMELPIREHYNLTSGGFGALSAFYYYAYVPMQIPVGILMDKYRPRRLLALACFLCALGTYLFAATPWFYVAAIGRFLVGFGSAFAFVGVLKLATMWLPEDKLALVAGLAAALGTVGAMLGDNMLGYFVEQYSWDPTIHYTAVFGFVLVLVLWVGIKDKRNYETFPSYSKPTTFAESLQDLKIIATNPQIWINGAFGCFVYLPTTVFAELWGIPYLEHAQHLSQKSAGFGNSMLFLGFTIGAPLMGIISDKIHRRVLPMRVGALGALITVSALIYLPGLSHFQVYLFLFFLG